jgi:hypothetical protein
VDLDCAHHARQVSKVNAKPGFGRISHLRFPIGLLRSPGEGADDECREDAAMQWDRVMGRASIISWTNRATSSAVPTKTAHTLQHAQACLCADASTRAGSEDQSLLVACT